MQKYEKLDRAVMDTEELNQLLETLFHQLQADHIKLLTPKECVNKEGEVILQYMLTLAELYTLFEPGKKLTLAFHSGDHEVQVEYLRDKVEKPTLP